MAGYSPAEESRRLREDKTDNSGRTGFARDRDRILYSSWFRALAGKTQVVSTSELGRFHTRLTHSLKVAQLGRVLAKRLQCDARNGDGPDPDVVEAACLAQDIGHAPFGHAGEEELCKVMDELSPHGDGFEGNAQTFRVVTHLTPKSGERKQELSFGLNLTRATLRALVKYPWQRGESPDLTREKKWSAYSPDSEMLQWALDGRSGESNGPIEEQIMDLCVPRIASRAVTSRVARLALRPR